MPGSFGTSNDEDGAIASTGSSAKTGVFGRNDATTPAPAGSVGGNGVFGLSLVPNASGVFGANNGGGTGVFGESRRSNHLYERSFIDPATLQFGIDTKFEVGKFYTQPALKFSYYCEEVSADSAVIVLVESFRFGQLVQARTSVPLVDAPHYVELTDPQEISRLTAFYERTISKGGFRQPGLYVGCTWTW